MDKLTINSAQAPRMGRWKGESFTKTLLVERDLAATLEQAKSFFKRRTS